MNLGDFLKTTKGKVISIAGVSVVAVGIAAAVLLQGEGYRSISVEQIGGSVNVVGEKNNGQAYVGEHLYSGDDVTVGDESELTMCMDNDKYVYADANTHFSLEASDAKDDSRIKIYLDAGSELNELQSQLAEGESYEVDTPNSTMSVRGTIFRVTVYTDKNGMTYTLTEVTEGTVKIRLKTRDGKYNGIEQDFTAGQSALIRGNDEFSEFVTSDMLDSMDLDMDDLDETVRLLLAYNTLPEGGLDRLLELLERLEAKEKKPEPTPTPTPKATPTPKPKPTPKVTRKTASAKKASLAETLGLDSFLAEWVVGYDPATGCYTLKDGRIFDPAEFARNNPNAVAAVGNNPLALLRHYLTVGPDEVEEEPESSESSPSPTPPDTPGYTYVNGLVLHYGSQIGTISNGKFQAQNSVGGGPTVSLPFTLSGTTYSIANNTVDISGSASGTTYDEPDLAMSTAVSALQSSPADAVINTNKGRITSSISQTGAQTFDGVAHDIVTFDDIQSAGYGNYTFNPGGSSSNTVTYNTENSPSTLEVTTSSGSTTYNITSGTTAPAYDRSTSSFKGTVDDPSGQGTRNFEVHSDGTVTFS